MFCHRCENVYIVSINVVCGVRAIAFTCDISKIEEEEEGAVAVKEKNFNVIHISLSNYYTWSNIWIDSMGVHKISTRTMSCMKLIFIYCFAISAAAAAGDGVVAIFQRVYVRARVK